MKKYKVSSYLETIETVEVTRETEASVWIKVGDSEARLLKNSSYEKILDTWKEAYNCLFDRCLHRVEAATLRLQEAKEELVDVQNLIPPKTPHPELKKGK